jgi:hypothetical protein
MHPIEPDAPALESRSHAGHEDAGIPTSRAGDDRLGRTRARRDPRRRREEDLKRLIIKALCLRAARLSTAAPGQPSAAGTEPGLASIAGPSSGRRRARELTTTITVDASTVAPAPDGE